MNKFSLLLISILIITACSSKGKLDIEQPELANKLIVNRFDQELLQADIYNLKALNSQWTSQYGVLYESFINQMINAGLPQDPMIDYRLEKFLTDTTIIQIKNKINEVFNDFSSYESELNNSFAYYSHYYPKNKIPTLITFYSNFNAKSFPYKDTLGIGLDMFLGRDEEIISFLAPDLYPQYLKQDMDPEYLVTETMKSWVYTHHSRPQEYANSSIYGVRDDFLSSIIYHGKMMVFLEAISPDKNLETIFAYTKKEMDWCEKNEQFLFQNLIEFELLYSQNIREIKAYVNPGSFTPGLPQESPGEIGKWIGYKMVKNYFENNAISLQQLIENENDAREILRFYKP